MQVVLFILDVRNEKRTSNYPANLFLGPLGTEDMETSITNYKRGLGEKIEKMCNAYYFSSKDETDQVRQFAVMWIGEGDYSKKAKEFDTTSKSGLLDKGDYYLAARFAGYKDYVKRKPSVSNSTGEPPITKLARVQFDNVNKHTEVVILENIQEYLDKIEKTTPKPNLYLFSWKSPCCGTPPSETCPKGCSGELKKWFGENKASVGKMTIAWDWNYNPQNLPIDRHFLYGLYCILTEDGMKIEWRDTFFCPETTKRTRDWFQRDLFQCIRTKEKTFTWYGCTKEADFTRDVATLINRITWQCGTRDSKAVDIDTRKTRYSSEPKCWEPNVDALLKKKGVDFTNLKKIILDCLQEKQKKKVGPALDPENPMKYSNEAKDVKGDPKDLCFEN